MRIKWLTNRGPVLRTFPLKEGQILRNKFVLKFSQKERIQKCSLMLPLSITEHDVKNKHTNVNLQRRQYITMWIKMLHTPTRYFLATCIPIEEVLYKLCAKYNWNTLHTIKFFFFGFVRALYHLLNIKIHSPPACSGKKKLSTAESATWRICVLASTLRCNCDYALNFLALWICSLLFTSQCDFTPSQR